MGDVTGLVERLEREAGLVGDSDFLASLLREAAAALSALSKEVERRGQIVDEQIENCEHQAKAARDRNEDAASYLFEGGAIACEAIKHAFSTDLSPATNSPPRNSGVDGESDVPANGDENAPE